MNNLEIIESFNDLKKNRLINKTQLMVILEDVISSALNKQFGQDLDFDLIMNPDNGDMEIWRNYTVVENGEVENPIREIELSEVVKVEPDFEVGEQFSVEIKMSDLERRNILSIRQNLKSKITDFQSKIVAENFTDLINEIYSAEVYLIKKDVVILIDDNGNEIFIPKKNQIPGDFFKKGEQVRGIIESVEIKSGKPHIIMSRTCDLFLERLMEMEIPEVMDGLISVKNVKRIPGKMAKVIVESYDDRIDPIGACVGVRGSRINGITKELNNEYVDFINWSENKKLLITRAIKPAKINSVTIEEKSAIIEMDPSEIAKAVGKGGRNIKLASLITGIEIEIYNKLSDEDDDVYLSEFSDEIEQWIINEFIKAGLDTAKSILKIKPEHLQKLTDLEDETIKEILEVLKSEFE